MALRYGPWETVRDLEQGGQARTFIVKDVNNPDAPQRVLKRLSTGRLERARREEAALRSLKHKNIVEIVDADLEAPKPYIVMEYCDGGSLDRAEAFWKGQTIVAIELFEGICEGVAYMHAQGYVHRDLKPANIFIRPPDTPVIGDFGICYVDDDAERITATAEAVGPRAFICPELEGGRQANVTSACDVYALGKLLYWLLSGGRILPRENHRFKEWDLKERNNDSLLGWNKPYMEHMNRILDLMIVVDPECRRGVPNLQSLLRNAKRLIDGRYNAVSPDIPQLCTYCGNGRYIVLPDDEPLESGYRPDLDRWRFLICNACGHVQTFRPDKAGDTEWWKQ